MIEPAIAIDIDRRAADIRRVIGADKMPHPIVRTAIFKPINRFLRILAARDKVEIAILVDIDERRLAVRVSRKIAIDEMMAELEFSALPSIPGGNAKTAPKIAK